MDAEAKTRTSWSEEQIRKLLKSESFNYQAINLPYGLSTGGHDRSATARLIMADIREGESVIDVGCSLGYFCFEARRHRAAQVVGMDFNRENQRKGRILAEILSEAVEFRVGDIEGEGVQGSFDHVLCLNVLHHLANPILGLDRLIAATKRRLVLEIATFGAHDARKLGLSWLRLKLLAPLPALIVGRGTAAEGVKQFYLTPAAIENLLRYRRGCFASVEILPSEFKQRFIVIARKRQIGQLLVVGGPTASGKTAVIESLSRGEFGLVQEFLGMKNSKAWSSAVLIADQYHQPQPVEHERLTLSYDVMRPFNTGAGTFGHDPALDIIAVSSQASFLTLWLQPDEWRERTRKAIATRSQRQRKRLKRAMEMFGEPNRLIEQYRAWFEYTSGKGPHCVLWMKKEGPMLLNPEDWERIIAGPQLAKPQ